MVRFHDNSFDVVSAEDSVGPRRTCWGWTCEG